MMRSPFDKEGMNRLDMSPTDPRYGCFPAERKIEELLEKGLLIIDKPRGPTSHQSVSWIKDIFGIDKAGHHGTLDPNTTGVLPVALGDGVKLLDTTLAGGKEYIAIMRLHSDIPVENVRSIIKDYTGEIYQMVPVRSAVKRGLRTRTIHYLKLIEKDGNDNLIVIGCESGTYIRTMIHDMGEVLGVGANMNELRRSRSGRIGEDRAVTLHDIRDAWEIYKETGDETLLRKVVRPCEELLEHMHAVILKDTAVDAVCHGAPVGVPGLAGVEDGIVKDEVISILTGKGEVVGLGTARMTSTQMMKARSGEAVSPDRVIMAVGTYPRSWKKAERKVE